MSRPAASGGSKIEDWALAVVSAKPAELLSIGVAACAAGHSQTLMECVRCRPGFPMKFPAAVRHVMDSEAEHRMNGAREEDGPNAALHGPGDIRPLTPDAAQLPDARRAARDLVERVGHRRTHPASVQNMLLPSAMAILDECGGDPVLALQTLAEVVNAEHLPSAMAILDECGGDPIRALYVLADRDRSEVAVGV